MLGIMRDREITTIALGNATAASFLKTLDSFTDKEIAKDILIKVRNTTFLRGAKLGKLYEMTGENIDIFHKVLKAVGTKGLKNDAALLELIRFGDQAAIDYLIYITVNPIL